jgi:serine protease Do
MIRNFIAVIGLLFITLQLQAASGLPDFTKIVEKVKPSVVNIEAKSEKNSKSNSRIEGFFNPFGRQSPQQSVSRGTGFIISKDGYILTNRHVVTGAKSIKVRLQDNQEYKAELIGEDDGTDVALLKIEAKKLRPVEIGNSSKLKVGEWVLAIGAPFGFDYSVTAGIVSAKGRSLRTEQFVPFIQTDVAINPGNSGGPLVDLSGEVVGINSQILSGSGGYMGLSFAIPMDVAMDIGDQLKRFGKVKRGFIGVVYQEVDADLAESFELDAVYGALINEVVKDGPADDAGIKVEDIIVEFNGKRVNKATDLPVLVGSVTPGEKVKVKILRNGKYKTLSLKVGERETAEGIVEKNNGISLGLSISEIPMELQDRVVEKGVFVNQVRSGPAAEAGIRRGDIILSLDRKPTETLDDFKDIVAELPIGKPIPVLILRNGRQKSFLTLTIDE